MTNTTTKLSGVEYLESEYPRGLELIYIDRSDEMNEKQALEYIKNGYVENEGWIYDSEYFTINEILGDYQRYHLDGEEIEEDEREEMVNWLQEHNTSDVWRDLARNTGDIIFYIESDIEYIPQDEDSTAELMKIAKTSEQVADIKELNDWGFYASSIGFYFKLDVADFKDEIMKDGKYITIKNAHIGNVERYWNGSNTLAGSGTWDVTFTKEDFLKGFNADKAGAGYSWHNIAGWSSSNYKDGAVICGDEVIGLNLSGGDTSKANYENELQAKWDKTKVCTFGDMHFNRHAKTEYQNEPMACGTKCLACGTFWID